MSRTTYPFILKNALFTKLEFSRESQAIEDVQIKFSFQIRINADRYPHIEIFLKLETLEETPVKIFLELVGIYDLAEGFEPPDRDIVNEFVQEKAIFMLWQYLNQTIKQITTMMGINPLNLDTPVAFNFELPSLSVEE